MADMFEKPPDDGMDMFAVVDDSEESGEESDEQMVAESNER